MCSIKTHQRNVLVAEAEFFTPVRIARYSMIFTSGFNLKTINHQENNREEGGKKKKRNEKKAWRENQIMREHASFILWRLYGHKMCVCVAAYSSSLGVSIVAQFWKIVNGLDIKGA